MSDIFLTYGWVRSTYAALRNLTDHQLSVIVGDNSSFGMSQFSRFHSGFRKYSSHYTDEQKFINELLDICHEQKPQLLLPSHNETEIIAKHRHLFDANIVACIPPYSLIQTFNNKKRSYDLAEKLNIPTPKRLTYTNPKTVKKMLEKKGISQTVIKLLTGNSSKGVFYANSPHEAQFTVEKLIADYGLEKDRYPQVEERVEGEGFGVSVLYWDGQLIAEFCHRRLRDKIATGGTSTLREAAFHEGIQNAAKKLFDGVGWHGLAMCEFKVCPKTGEYWFIEVNPRMWGSIALAINCGVEFPYLAWLCAQAGPSHAISYLKSKPRRHKWTARWLMGDIFVGVKLVLKLKFITAFSILFLTKSDSLDDFFFDDLLVFFGQVARYLGKVVGQMSLNPSNAGMLR